MSFSVQMPALGESVSEGTVTRWLKKEGDSVEADEPLLEVSTDKVDTEIPSPVSGVLEKIIADEDETIEIGGELALIDEGGEGGSDDEDADDSDDADDADDADDDSDDDSEDAPESDAAGTDEAEDVEEADEDDENTDVDAGEMMDEDDEADDEADASPDGTDVTMPELGESVTEGTVTKWLKKVGDTVEVDEPLLEVSTDKVDTEIPSPVAGAVLEILAEEDETIEVGDKIAVIGDEASAAGKKRKSASKSDDSDSESDDSDSSDDSGDSDDSDDEKKSEDTSEEKSDKPKKSSKKASGTDVTMPELGESVTEGTVTKWLKSVGDDVEVDEPLLEVSTDKVDTEIPSPVAGTLLEIVADEDDTIEVGEKIAVIGDGDADDSDEPDDTDEADDSAEDDTESSPEEDVEEEDDSDDTAEEKQSEPKKSDSKQAESKSESKSESESKKESSEKEDSGSEKKPAEPASPGGRAKSGSSTPYVTPLVRRLAEEHGVDLEKVEGTGIGGRIRKQDVLAAAEGGDSGSSQKKDSSSDKAEATGGPSSKGVRPELAELRGTTKKANRIRKITAQKTRESLQTSAQLTQVHEVDMTRVAMLREAQKDEFKSKHDLKLTFLPFYAKAVVEALVSHPNVNASYDEESNEITYHEDVNLGIAVDTEQGLLSPVIKKAQDMNIPELSKAIIDLAKRARDQKLGPDDLMGGTFTLTNIGSEGALFDTPILVPPQAAMLGTGAIVRRPVVESDEEGEVIAIRAMGYLPLTYDHRLIDGADAGRFLTTVRDRLETGEFEGDLGL